MSDLEKAARLALELRQLANKFSEGWHDGIKIDASDVILLADVAAALEQQLAEPVDKELTKAAPPVDKVQAEPVSALTRYNEIAADSETYTGHALERLRIFCSLAMTEENWLDAELFFDDAEQELTKLERAVLEKLAADFRKGLK